jgi:IclR family acetate operon transcriptional repressor
MSTLNESPSVAVERAIDILEAIAQRESGMTNSEISRRLAIPKSSASYILRTLELRGYLRRERGTGRYRLGLKVLSLGRGAQTSMGIRDVALPILRRLVERTGLTAHLAVLDNGEAVYLDKAESSGFIRIDTWIGRRLDVHSTAVGKALAAFLPDPEVEAIVHQRGLKRRTPKTITAPAKFLHELSKVRDRGYAIDDEENNVGARCVAAPVLDNFAKAVAAVGVGGTTGQMDRPALAKAGKEVKEAAREIAEQIGYRNDSSASLRK